MSNKPELHDLVNDSVTIGRLIGEGDKSSLTEAIIDIVQELAHTKSDLSDANDTVANYLRDIRQLELNETTLKRKVKILEDKVDSLLVPVITCEAAPTLEHEVEPEEIEEPIIRKKKSSRKSNF